VPSDHPSAATFHNWKLAVRTEVMAAIGAEISALDGFIMLSRMTQLLNPLPSLGVTQPSTANLPLP